MGFFSSLFHRRDNNTRSSAMTLTAIRAIPDATPEEHPKSRFSFEKNLTPENVTTNVDSAPDSAMGLKSPLSSPYPTSSIAAIPLEPKDHTITLAPRKSSLVEIGLSTMRVSSDSNNSMEFASIVGSLSQVSWKYSLHLGVRTAKSHGVPIQAVSEAINAFWEEEEETLSLSKIYSTELSPIAEESTEDIIAGESILTRDASHTADEWYQLGKEYAKRNQHFEAINYYNKALTQEKKAQYYCKIALSYFLLENMPAAEYYCKESLILDKSYDKAYHTLSAIYRFHSRAYDDNSPLAQAYHEMAKKYLKLSQKYGKDKNSPPYLFEKTLISMEKGNIKTAHKYLHKVKNELIKQNAIEIDDKELEQENKNQQAKLSLIEDIADCTKSSLLDFNRASKKIPKDKIIVMRNVIEKLKLFPQPEELHKLMEEMMQLKLGLGKLETKSRDFVRYNEVSMAINHNPSEELKAAQMQQINASSMLREYFGAFVFTIHRAYSSAMVISEGNISTDTQSIVLDITERLLSLIPLCGNTIGAAVSGVGEFLKDREIKNAGAHLLKIAYSSANLDEKILPAARAITLERNKQKPISLAESKSIISSFLSKILNKIEEAHALALKKLYTELHDTDAKRAGHDDACKVIAKWIVEQEKLNSSAILTDKYIIDFIQKAVIGDSVHATITPMPIHDNGADIGAHQDVEIEVLPLGATSQDSEV